MASGAIAGPLVELDVRTLYLKDLTLAGSTYQHREVFENLVAYIEAGEVSPVVTGTYQLADIKTAVQDFLGKGFAGKLVLVPATTA
ncbi:MAG: NADPH:quinone reductase-like Zn-dependent oxidoreductase [Candidatus Poriferisodalaceae bacterium]